MAPNEFVNKMLESLPGVSHVVLLSEDGKPKEFGSLGSLKSMPKEWISGIEHFAGSLTVALKDSAKRISETNETPYEPMRGWFYTGGDWGVCVASLTQVLGSGSGFVAAFFLTQVADSRPIFDAMIVRGFKSPAP